MASTNSPAPDSTVMVALGFPDHVLEYLTLGQCRPFGRSDFHPPDDSISTLTGEIRVIAEGALVIRYPEPTGRTQLWLANDTGRSSQITAKYPLLVRDDAVILVGTRSGRLAGHRFQIGVSLAKMWPVPAPSGSGSAGLGKQRPGLRGRPTRPPSDLRLSDRQRDALAALTIDYPSTLVGRPLIRPTRQAELPGRPEPLNHKQIQQATIEVAELLRRVWVNPKTGKTQQSVCDWVVDNGVIGPADWNRVQPWLR